MNASYSPTRDPLFYVAVGFFALITTGLPAMIGLSRLLPLMQGLALAVFVILAVRRGETRHAVWVMAVWLVVQFLLVTLLAWVFTARLENAVAGGFEARGAILEWHFADRLFPGSLPDDPWRRLGEIAGVTLGALATAGVVGDWVVVRAVNVAGLQLGAMLANAGGSVILTSPFLWLVIPRLAGLAGLAILFTEPLLTRTWSPGFYWRNRRRLIVVSVALLALGLILESLVR
ncbi:MAG: hypothetical protein KDD83_07460 [Caldilineaceae bacterium]|nr:hypothetical protein [Caldilineaceae bacterium]